MRDLTFAKTTFAHASSCISFLKNIYINIWNTNRFEFSSRSSAVSWREGECLAMIVKSRLPFACFRNICSWGTFEQKTFPKEVLPRNEYILEYTSPPPTQKYLSNPVSDSFPRRRSPRFRVCVEGGLTDECFSDIGNTLRETDRGAARNTPL